MSYAIVINLDYENNSEEICQEIWDEIKESMLKAGFSLDNRLFITRREDKEACELARSVLDGLEEHLDFDEIKVLTIYKRIRVKF